MRYYKRRILPNSRETVINFNKRQVSEKIEDHNDPNKRNGLILINKQINGFCWRRCIEFGNKTPIK